MKKEIKKENYRVMHPKLTFLLTSVDENGKANVMSLAWASPVSMEPLIIGIAVGKESLTSENIKKTKEFVLNIPSINLLNAVKKCGSKSGRDVDKFIFAGINLEPSELVKVPRIKECIAHLECKMITEHTYGDCFLFIGEVLKVVAEEKYYKNYWLDNSKIILHLGGNYFAIHKLYKRE